MRALAAFVMWVVVLVLLLGFLASTLTAFMGLLRINGRSDDSMILAGGASIVLLGALMLMAFLAFVLSKAPGTPHRAHSQRLAQDEARLVQEIHGSLGRMEQRIEALETLLLDRSTGPARSESFREAGHGAVR